MKTLSLAILSSIAISLFLMTNAEAGVIRTPGGADRDYVPTGKGWGVPDLGNPVGQAKGGNHGGGGGGKGGHTKSNGINYHGGPVMTAYSTNIYYIWYGDWSGNLATTILENFANNLGGSPYFNINTTYYDSNNNYVNNVVAFAGSTTVAYPYGTSLGDAEIQSIVSDAIKSNALPSDENAVYVVLTSADVIETSGFCSQYCGWHTHGTIGGADIKYAFVGDPAQCPSGCAAQTTSPNGTLSGDAMASIIAHEFEEAVTDPDLNGWYDHRGYENADKCAWKFGTTYTTSNGSLANMKLGSNDYLIQQNWVNANGGGCVLTYP